MGTETGSQQLPRSSLLLCVWGAKRVADNHILPADKMRRGVETFRHGVTGSVAIQHDGRRGNGLQEGFVHVTFAAGQAVRDQIFQQRLAAGGGQERAAAGGDGGIRKGAGRKKERLVSVAGIAGVIAAPGKIAEQIGAPADEGFAEVQLVGDAAPDR